MLSVWFFVNRLRTRWEVDEDRHGGRERGASLVEYALLLSLIALVCVTALSFFGGENSGSLTDSADSIVG